MFEIINREASSCELKDLVGKFIPESISKEIEKATQGIYPLHDVFLRKVKIIKKPKFDIGRLLEIHGEIGTSVNSKGEKVARSEEFKEPAPLASV